MKTQFNTDTQALVSRLDINKSSALYDLEEWIFNQVRLKDSMKILDIGCGTGKQLFALAKQLSPDCEIMGVDLSADAVTRVNEQAMEKGLTNVKGVQCGIDDVIATCDGEKFDLIVSTYAIYYSSNLPLLLRSLKEILTEDGQLFVSGFGKESNQEVYDLVNGVAGSGQATIDSIEDFISAEDIANVASVYSSSVISRLDNKIIFISPEDVMTWWENHNSFISDLRQGAQESVSAHFQSQSTFPLSKNVLGVLYEL
jgi:cyclopropane fatty-acyl-phospholipid synthase-like methyltransferase